MLRIELSSVDLVVQFGGELALRYVVTGKFARIWIEDGQLHVAETHRDIGIELRPQYVELAGDRNRRILAHRTVQIHFRPRSGIRGNSTDGACQRLNAG